MPIAADLAFLFPGQGSQSLGMLAELAAAQPLVEQTFAEASAGCGLDLWSLAQTGPEAELNRTELTQPALLAAGVAVWRVWTANPANPTPIWLAGHSLGEYTALVCAGALSLADGAALVRERGRLMQNAVAAGSGAMAAVLGSEDALIAAACAEAAQGQVVSPANFNSPSQTVIAGDSAAVERAIVLLAERGVKKVVRLPVSVPSHCALMQGAALALRERLDALSWSLPSIPVLQNADVSPYYQLDEIKDALARQLYMPVRWLESMQLLAQVGITRFAECGPGRVLTSLVKRIDKTLDARALGSPADLAEAQADWS